MMSVEQRWGGLGPDMAITYSAKSDNESTERWKSDRMKRFSHLVFQAFFEDNYTISR